MYASDIELKTKDDYINLLNEIIAYRDLDGGDFDFGTGLIINEMSLGSEDAYYEMDIQNLEEFIKHWVDNKPTIYKRRSKRMNRYAINRKYRRDLLRKASMEHHYGVWNNGGILKRYYRSPRSSFLKKQSSKIIRKHKGDFQKKGNKHKRVFDFWWELD